MSLSKRNVDRCLQLLWECRSHTEQAEQRQAYGQAISSLHAYLTDVLPATLPCVRANAQHGVVELFQDQETRAQDVDLILDEGDKLGIVLDKINVNELSSALPTASPIAISLLKPHSVAGKDNRLARGDQILSINGHSLSRVSLQRARWLLDSAERSQKVSLSIITSGLLDGLKHSISRHDVNSLTPQASHHVRSRSRESLDRKRVQRLLKQGRAEPSPKTEDKNEYPMQPVKPQSHSSVHNRPGFAPSIGSQNGSNYSLVSSTVETAAHIARSSMRSSRYGASLGKQFKKRKVRKMHIMKGASGLGLRIIGGKGSKYGDMGIFVRQLEEGGAAFNDQRLHPGDELLMVDGKTLVGLTHDEAVAVLTATQKLVQLVVATEHTFDGESIDSSMQSIPESMINRAGIVNTQIESGQSSCAMAAADTHTVAPEFHKSPLRNTFQNDEYEMKALSISAERLSTEVETSFYDGNVHRIELERSEGQPLGFSIKQGSSSVPTKRGIFIHAIDPHGAVGKNTQLREGDQLLKVNELSLDNFTREEALDILTALKGNTVTFEVLATQEKQILLHRTSGQPLGIQLTSSSAAGALPRVAIKKIAVDSPANASGKLCVGDQLVSVNGMSLFAMNVEQVRGLLASIPGEEIKLVVLGCHNLPSRHKKTQVEQNINDVDAIEVRGEMDCGVTASPEVPESAPPLMVANSEPEDSGSGNESDEDSICPTTVIKISQHAKSRPESSFIEISGGFQAPESPQSTHASSISLDQPPVLDMPSPDLPFGLPQIGGPLPPDGYLALRFSIKKRPRGDLGVTLVASEGATTGYFMVRRVTPNGAAAKDGRLQIGDRLVSVNGESLHNFAHAAILQALKEAVKEITVVVWRDPSYHLASSSMHSLGSNLSGSHSSLHSEDGVIKKRRKGLHSPAAQNSPLVARMSYGGIPSSPVVAEKRWSEGAVSSHLSETKLLLPPNLPVSIPLEADALNADPPDLPESAIPLEDFPPEVPEATPPKVPEATPPKVPEATPPEVPEDFPPEVPEDFPPKVPEATPPEVPEDFPPEVPEDFPPEVPEATPPEVPGDFPPEVPEATPPEVLEDSPPEVPEALPPEVPKDSPPEVPEAMPPEVSTPPDVLPEISPGLPEAAPEIGSTEVPIDMTPGIPSALASPPAPTLETLESRPRSLQVPRGERKENTPFEIELKKGLLGIGVSLALNEMGMLVFSSISSRSVLSQDGNIKVGDQLLAINDDNVIELSAAEVLLKGLPRGLFRLTVMAPFKDVSKTLGAQSSTTPPATSALPKVPTTAPPLPQGATAAALTLPTCTAALTQPQSPTATPTVPDGTAATSKEHIVEETLQRSAGRSLGFEIEGGSDTPLNYVYIKSLMRDSPAANSGQFTSGDQLVMVGDTCFIGLSYAEAASALDEAPATVTVVAQRKAVTAPVEDPALSLQADNGSVEVLVHASEMLESAASIEDLQASAESERTYNTEKQRARKTSLMPEEKMTVELTRHPGEKLGIGIVGGIDNPNLRHIHVKQVTSSGAAARDGRIKKGDRIISVNDLSITGMSNKQALQTLKAAGDHVTLVTSRKVGRRQSRATTPLASARHSRQGSGETSRAESRMSPQRSPRSTVRRIHSSSDEGSRDSSRGPSPQHPRKHYRRKSVTTAKGEIITFTDRKSTLPRKIKGAKLGVQLVELHKGPTGLGIQLQGSADGTVSITVKAVLRGGPAFRSGKVHVGDEIIEVNGTSFEKLSQQEALKIIKDLPQGKVSIILRDSKAFMD